MKYYILASVILFGFLIHRANKIHRKEHDSEEISFWEKERAANNVRKKSLDGLPFISLSNELQELIKETIRTLQSMQEDQISTKDSDSEITQDSTKELFSEEELNSLSECMSTLEDLTSKKIVNLTGISNTDLKLEYGTANITVLTEYDQNYTVLARCLNQWGSFLKKNGQIPEAKKVLEFAIETKTDISNTYYDLAEIYAKDLDFSKIEELNNIAEELPSANKNAIVRHLQESYL